MNFNCSKKTRSLGVVPLSRSTMLAGLLFATLSINASETNSLKKFFPNATNRLVTASSFQVQKQIKGKVIDETGLPVPGANVIEKNGTASVQTDMDGNFSITVPSSNSILVISFVGMETQEVKASGEFLSVVLLSQNKN